MRVDEAVHILDTIQKAGGPVPATYALTKKALTVLANAAKWMGREAAETLLERYVMNPIRDRPAEWTMTLREVKSLNILHHIYSQPHGYAGDWELMLKYYMGYETGMTGRSQIYQDQAMTLSMWDHWILGLDASTALYTRENLLFDRISMLVDQGKIDSVLEIASGPGHLAQRLSKKYPNLEWMGIDLDGNAVAYSQSLKLPERYQFQQLNALTHLPQVKYDLVVSSGLCDYLSDAGFIRLVRRILEYNYPDYIILGNMAETPDAELLRLVKWNLIYRTDEQLWNLCAKVKGLSLEEYKIEILQEPLGVNLFAYISARG